jgi:hypothetical protein
MRVWPTKKRTVGIDGADYATYLKDLGFVFADWVDEVRLNEIAEQLQVRFPAETLQKTGRETTRGLEVGPKDVGLTASIGMKSSTADERRFGGLAVSLRLRKVLETLALTNEAADLFEGSFAPTSAHMMSATAVDAVAAATYSSDDATRYGPLEEWLLNHIDDLVIDWFLLDACWAVTSVDPLDLEFRTDRREHDLGGRLSIKVFAGGYPPRPPVGARLRPNAVVRATVFGTVERARWAEPAGGTPWQLVVAAIAVFDRKAGNAAFKWDAFVFGPPNKLFQQLDDLPWGTDRLRRPPSDEGTS